LFIFELIVMNRANWILFLLSLALLAACGKKAEESKPAAPGTPVTVMQSELRTVELLEESVGTLESFADPIISAEVPGKVLEIRAVAGSEIKVGQVLAVLDAQDVSLSYQAAQAEMQRVETLSNNQTKDLERLKQLREKNFISQSALDDAIAQASALQNQMAAAKAQLALAERNVGKAHILSPVDGRVERQIAVRGQYVKLGDPLFQVVALNKLRVRLPFPESFSAQLLRGMPVRVSSSADAATLTGKISEIRPMAGAGNRAFDVFVTLDNPGVWKPGASVVGKVVLGEHQNAVVVSAKSVVLRPAGKVVYVANAGKAEQRKVVTGIEQNGMVEILSGINANEPVIVDGAGFLTDQAPILVKDQNAPVSVNAASAVVPAK
jgi:RND family efflux transporter MFP subunit